MNRDVHSFLVKSLAFNSFRPKLPAVPKRYNIAWRKTTSTVGENKSGFVKLGPEEGFLLFNNLLPIIRTRLHAETRQRALLQDVQKEHDKKVDWFKKHCFPDSLMNDPSSDDVFTIREIVPQAKEGGLFVKYHSSDPTRVQTEIKEHLKREKLYAQPRFFFKKPVKGFPFRGNPWLQELFLPKSVKMFPVRGVPWIEDMDRFPNKRLRVEFVSGEGTLSQEIIYYLFRRYGKIADIIPQPAPPKHSGLPQFVVIKFRKIRGATAAKGCLNGFKTMDGNGNEVMLRVLYGRGFRFRWAGDWIANNLRFSIPLILTVVGLVAVWIFDPIRARNVKARITGSFDFSQKYIKEKLNTLSKLKTFITTHVPGQKETEPEDTMADLERLKTWLDKTAIVVYGHRCGKLDLIKDVVLKDRKHVLVIDCKPIAEAPSDREMIIEIADQIGYRPLFSWLNNLSELALRAAMGSSGGAEYSTEIKLGGIFQVMRNAFKELALRSKSGNVSDEEYLHQNPGERPVLVIDNFLHNESGSIIYEKLAECATQLVADKHANVIFIANDSSFFKSLPDSLFRTMLLKDPQESTHVTVDEMVAHDVMGLYILQDGVRKKRAWTSEQAWYFVQALTYNNQIEYNKVLLDPLFLSGGENAMQHLQQAGLISIVMHGNGRPASIKLGKENYREAFKMLTDDVALKDKMDLQTCIVRKDIEGEKIARIEEELSKIAKLKALPVRRQEYLLERVSESQEKIDKFEEKIGELKKKLLENGKADDSVGWRHRIAEAYRS